ncbi:MAG: hypothetical protein QNJ05_07215 [Woeseiaceae bacterium]|nr:hypothetical protein [Woeseiaceae bacterium]
MGLRTVLTVCASLFIVACDGANQGVQIGNGQTPDPVVIDFPIAYIRAPIPVDDNGEFEQTDLREQITFDVGSDLFFRDRASPTALDVNITGRVTGGMGAVRDIEIDYDASRLLFSMRGPFDPDLDEEDQPTWNIWQYTFETDELVRVIPSDLTAEIGHDIMPKYLPDGRIIFASTRQVRSQAVLLDEGKPGFVAIDEDENEYAFTIHVMNDDGSSIEQLTFNQSHDLDPTVMSDGKIVFSRWDNAGPNNAVDLYRMNPDGSELELLYGKESHDTGTNGTTIQFTQPRELEDGNILTLIRPFTDTEGGGELITIDTTNYVENTQPVLTNPGGTGPAQADATINQVLTQAGASPGGRYASAYPIQDGTGRMLVGWSQCRLIEFLADDGDPDTEDTRIVPCTDERLANLIVIDPDDPVTPVEGEFIVAPPLYGIWIYDPRDETQLPVVVGEEGFMFTEVVSGDPRPRQVVIPDGQNDFPLDPTLKDNAEAVLNIRSVYDFNGTAAVDIATVANPAVTMAANRPARWIRIEKPVSFPDEDTLDIDNTAFGISQANGMREILGYAEVAPDGSVLTKIPANVAFSLTILDENGHRISPRHQNWLSARPGQELKCIGCHVPGQGVSHGRADAFDSAWAGAPSGVVEFPGTDSRWFINEVGDTMAETFAKASCDGSGACDAIAPSVNIEYNDFWAADPTIAANNGYVSWRYTRTSPSSPDIPIAEGSNIATPSPTTTDCENDWSALCRIVINYETHIHPIWQLSRPVTMIDPVTGLEVPVLDAMGNPVDNMCVACHSPVNPADNTVRVPAGQLELQDGQSPDEPDHFLSYRELLVGDNLQEVVGGVLVDAQQVIGQDDMGNDILAPIPINSPATIGGARFSGDFFDRFADPANSHYNLLSEAERRMIAEWLDIGGQYYNNPFDAPMN